MAKKTAAIASKKNKNAPPPPPPEIEHEDNDGPQFDDKDPHDDLARTDHEFLTARSSEETDIFEECYQIAQEKGDTAQFRLYQNGRLLPTVDYPYDFDQLRAEHGPGHYKIVGIYSMTKTYIKSTQKVLAGGRPVVKEPSAAPAPARDAGSDMMAMFLAMQEKAEARAQQERERMEQQRREDRERAEQQRRDDNDRQNKFFEMMSENNKLQAQHMQTQLTASQEAARRSSEEMNKFLLTMLTKKETPPPPPQDPMLLIKMLSDARREGEERALQLQEMMDLKVAEAKEEAGKAGNKHPESLIQSIVKSVGPALAGLNQQQQQRPQIHAPAPRLAAVPAPAPAPVSVPAARVAGDETVDASRVIPAQAQPIAPAPAQVAGQPSSFIPLRSSSPATPARALVLELRAKIPQIMSGEVEPSELVAYCKEQIVARGTTLEALRAAVLDTDVAAVAKQMEIDLSDAREWLNAFWGFVENSEDAPVETTAESVPAAPGSTESPSATEAG